MDEYEPRLKPFARQLRTHQTEAENRLWHHLRRDQLGVRFYRQRPFGQYILDFYAPKARLVIELDGGQHQDDFSQQEKDVRRDAWLTAQGLQVLRFDDRQVLTETRAVLEVIFNVVNHAIGGGIPPSPPFTKGGEPQTSAAGFLPLEKVGQEGFDDARQTDQARE